MKGKNSNKKNTTKINIKNLIRSKEQNYLVVYPFDDKILYRLLTADEIKSVRRS